MAPSCGGIGESGGLLKSLLTNGIHQQQAAAHPSNVAAPAENDNSIRLRKSAELSTLGIGNNFEAEA